MVLPKHKLFSKIVYVKHHVITATKLTVTETRHGTYLGLCFQRRKDYTVRASIEKWSVLLHDVMYADLQLSKAQKEGSKVKAEGEDEGESMQVLRDHGYF